MDDRDDRPWHCEIGSAIVPLSRIGTTDAHRSLCMHTGLSHHRN